MAPEVLVLEDKTEAEEAAAAGYTAKADVWSLGVTLYVLLAGGEFPQAYPLKSRVAIKALAAGGASAAAWRMPPLPPDVPTALSDLIQVRARYTLQCAAAVLFSRHRCLCICTLPQAMLTPDPCARPDTAALLA